MIVSTILALKYENHKIEIKSGLISFLSTTRIYLEQAALIAFEIARTLTEKLFRVLGLIKN